MVKINGIYRSGTGVCVLVIMVFLDAILRGRSAVLTVASQSDIKHLRGQWSALHKRVGDGR